MAAGYSDNGSDDDFALARYNEDGSLDTSFTDGKVITDDRLVYDLAHSVAIQSDGKIVAAAAAATAPRDFALARYNPNGSLDTSFDSDGKVTTAIGTSNDGQARLAIQSDGKIVAAGYSSTGSTGTSRSPATTQTGPSIRASIATARRLPGSACRQRSALDRDPVGRQDRGRGIQQPARTTTSRSPATAAAP